MLDDKQGRVVISKSGRDKGRMFVVVQVVNDRFVMLVDGDLRKIENPKLKNLNHIQFTGMKAEDVIDCLARGETPEITSFVKTLSGLWRTENEMGRRSGKWPG
jgi:hypothetical protein